MTLRPSRHSVGVHLTDNGAYIVLLKKGKDGSGSRIVATGAINRKAEGIVSQHEMQSAIAAWVRNHGIERVSATLALPQNDVSCMVNSLPKMEDREKLQKLVDYQAQHLGGIAEERFISDFVQYTSSIDNSTRTLIILARESTTEKSLDVAEEANLNVSTLTCEGLAFANALFNLHPDVDSKERGLEILLWVGAEHPIAVLVFHGEIQAVSELESSSSILKMPLESQLELFIRKLPMASRIDKSRIDHIYICGEHSGLHEISERLRSKFKSDVTNLHLPTETEEDTSALLIAYGAALQGAKVSKYTLSLIPESMAWANLRRRSLHHLIWSFLIVVFALMTLATLFIRHLNAIGDEIDKREAHLEQCKKLEQQLDEAYLRIDVAQKRMMPLHELSARSSLFLDCLDGWKQCRPKDSGWEIYLADDLMFMIINDAEARAARRAERAKTKEDAEKPAATPVKVLHDDQIPDDSSEDSQNGATTSSTATETAITSRAAAKANADASAQPAANAPETPQPIYPMRKPVSRIYPIRAIYIGGYTISKSGAMYQTVKELQDKLNATHLFGNVDDCLEKTSQHFVDTFFTPWNAFLEKNKEGLKQQNTPFLLQLPLKDANAQVNIPPAPAATSPSGEQ